MNGGESQVVVCEPEQEPEKGVMGRHRFAPLHFTHFNRLLDMLDHGKPHLPLSGRLGTGCRRLFPTRNSDCKYPLIKRL
jgi:hypothetical protein